MEQSTNYLPYFITGFVMMLIGWAMGFFDSNMRSAKKIKQAETSANYAIEEARKKISQAESKLAEIAASPGTADDPGLLRIKNENGALTLDIDGTRVNTNTLSDEQRKRLIEMLTLVRPWVDGKPVNIPIATPLSPDSPQPVPLSPVVSQSTTYPTIIAKEDRPAAPAGSIVSQIDSVLQTRLAGTPLENRGIFLAQSLDGGVIVYVGITKYTSIDEVPDAEIKTAIRAAISEWENKYTPGL